MADAKIENLRIIQARLSRLPLAAQQALREGLPEEVDEGFIPAVKDAMRSQYETSDPEHESLIDSVHSYPNPDREISLRVIADAKDAEGKFIGENVEEGHKAADGSHVAGRPAFWPVWRAFRPGMKRRLGKRARDAVKQAWGG